VGSALEAALARRSASKVTDAAPDGTPPKHAGSEPESEPAEADRA
jgi:hypothetical protein